MSENPTPRLEMGGQAVLEGVLMRTQHGYSVAVRRSTGDILVRSAPFRSLGLRYPALKKPFLRGAFALFEMLAIGYQALRFSADVLEEDMKAAEANQKNDKSSAPGGAPAASSSVPPHPASAPSQPASQPSNSTPLPQDAASVWSNWAMAGVMVFSLVVGIAMMVIAPNLLAAGVGKLWAWGQAGWGAPNPLVEEKSPLLYNLVSGGFRAVILIGYIWAISFMPDIRRVFGYHGAEHKAVFAFEAKMPLTIENAQRFTTLHPRCGTSFLVIVLAISIAVFALVAWLYAWIWPGFAALPFVIKKILLFLGHIAALPLVAGCSYEVLKFSARRCERGGFWRGMIWPGLQVQRLTTRPPDDSMVETALVALKSALEIQAGEKEEKTFILPAGGLGKSEETA